MEKLSPSPAKKYIKLEEKQQETPSFQQFSQIKAFNDVINASRISLWSFVVCVIISCIKLLKNNEISTLRVAGFSTAVVLLKICERLSSSALPMVRQGNSISLIRSMTIFYSSFLVLVLSSYVFLYITISNLKLT